MLCGVWCVVCAVGYGLCAMLMSYIHDCVAVTTRCTHEGKRCDEHQSWSAHNLTSFSPPLHHPVFLPPHPPLSPCSPCSSQTKLNVLHLHATDSESMPLVIKARPEFAQISYSPGERYENTSI